MAGFIVMLVACPAGAGEVEARDPALGTMGWKEFSFSNIDPAEFTRLDNETIRVRSRDSASMLFRELGQPERDRRFLKWRWRVDKAVPPTDLREAGKDDRDISIHLWFPQDEKGGLFSALGRAVAKAMGAPTTGKAISYIFGGRGERGARLSNPFREGEAVYIILRPSGSALGTWFDEKVDFAADFERAFAMPAPRPAYIAISTDSDDTDTETDGTVGNLRFSVE